MVKNKTEKTKPMDVSDQKLGLDWRFDIAWRFPARAIITVLEMAMALWVKKFESWAGRGIVLGGNTGHVYVYSDTSPYG